MPIVACNPLLPCKRLTKRLTVRDRMQGIARHFDKGTYMLNRERYAITLALAQSPNGERHLPAIAKHCPTCDYDALVSALFCLVAERVVLVRLVGPIAYFRLADNVTTER